jgi:outer membrane phospholipase A
MKMKWLIQLVVGVWLLLTCATIALAFPESDGESSQLSPYRPSYLIFGDSTDQVKGQISLKYHLLQNYQTNLYTAYTQLMFWQLYDKSSPFRDINYNPEVFWQLDLWEFGLHQIRISPYEHKSNGRDGEESRSLNRCYLIGDVRIPMGPLTMDVRGGYRYYYNVASSNEDLTDYDGSFIGGVSLRLRDFEYVDREELYCNVVMGGENTFLWEHPSIEVGLRFRILSRWIVPHLYIQYTDGYNGSMLTYNQHGRAVRAGFIFL